MSSQQRLQVWRGERLKTSGGLTKADLVRNKRGKIVSKKKSHQASSQNNLGSWLREKGKKVPKAEMLRKKSAPPAEAPKRKPKPAAGKPKPAAGKPKPAAGKSKPAGKPAKAAPKAVPKKKPVPKPQGTGAAATAKPKKPVHAAPKKKPKVVRKQDKYFPKSKTNPLTKQAYAKKNTSGYVEKGKVSLDNVKRTRLRPKKTSYADLDLSALF